ncbi:hypothetical protein [Kribbella speibonae]|nr:hypothetical protein [Kribbella speibonae]
MDRYGLDPDSDELKPKQDRHSPVGRELQAAMAALRALRDERE